MSRENPFELVDQREREADELERHSEELAASVGDAREDWERKRADGNIPGAPPPEDDGAPDREDRRSPAPQAPSPSAGPGDAETPPEGGAGPPADA